MCGLASSLVDDVQVTQTFNEESVRSKQHIDYNFRNFTEKIPDIFLYEKVNHTNIYKLTEL